MSDRSWARRNPARREQLLERLRAVPGSTLTDLAHVMALSRSCVRGMLSDAEVAGLVGARYDATARATARSQIPKVYSLISTKTAAWVPPAVTAIIKRSAPRFPVRALHLPKYGPTGTPADRAGAVQVFAVAGWM